MCEHYFTFLRKGSLALIQFSKALRVTGLVKSLIPPTWALKEIIYPKSQNHWGVYFSVLFPFFLLPFLTTSPIMNMILSEQSFFLLPSNPVGSCLGVVNWQVINGYQLAIHHRSRILEAPRNYKQSSIPKAFANYLGGNTSQDQ